MSGIANDDPKATDLLGFEDLAEGMLVDVLGEWCKDLGWLSTIVHEKTAEHVIFGKWAQDLGSGRRFMGMTAVPCELEKRLLVQKQDPGLFTLRVRRTDLKAVLGRQSHVGPELE